MYVYYGQLLFKTDSFEATHVSVYWMRIKKLYEWAKLKGKKVFIKKIVKNYDMKVKFITMFFGSHVALH